MRARHDKILVALTLLIASVGILVFFSASLALLPKGAGAFSGALVSQVVLGLGGGLLTLWAIAQLPLGLLKRYAPHVFVLSLVLTAAVFIPGLGLTANGATRWLDLGVTTFQPSELLKIGYVLIVALILSRGRDLGADYRKGVIPVALITALVALVLLLQPDTDTFIVIALGGAAMLYSAGLSYRDMALGAVAALFALGLLLYMRPYLMDRVETFLNPSQDMQGASYQINQSLIAVGSGGLWGRGYGQSIQKFGYLPEASSDSVFAVYAEEFGFWGSVMLIVLYLSFVLRGFWVAARAQDLFGGLLVVGIMTTLGVQVFMNIMAMIGLIPVGGLPLPFVSHGGSALLVTLAMAGVVLLVSKSVRV